MRVLLVEDEEQLAGLAQRELEREYGHQVVVAPGLREAEKYLGEQTFDVVVVDILYDPLVTELDRRRLVQPLRPTDEKLLASGLSVITATLDIEQPPGIVVWTSSDPSRRLHLVFAYEDLGVRVFCSKRSGNGNLEPLHQAIEAAGARRRYADNILGVYLPGKRSFALSATLLREQSHRMFWRALALGYHTAEEIANVTPYAKKTVRSAMGKMLDDLRVINRDAGDTKKPQPELVRYASSNRYFFLDDAVRKLYP